jgi:hypothetical protein
MPRATVRFAVIAGVVLTTAAGITGCIRLGPESAKRACQRLGSNLDALLADCDVPPVTDAADCDVFSASVACDVLSELADCIETLECVDGELNPASFLACLAPLSLQSPDEACAGAVLDVGEG